MYQEDRRWVIDLWSKPMTEYSKHFKYISKPEFIKELPFVEQSDRLDEIHKKEIKRLRDKISK